MRDIDIVFRFGGEEFAVIMPVTDIPGAGIAAERARHEIEKTIVDFAGRQLRVTFSGGVASAMPGESLETFISRADSALYTSKSAGRNCVHLHEGAQRIRLTDALEMQLAHQTEPPLEAPAFQPAEQASQCAAPIATAERLAGMPDLSRFSQQLRQEIIGRQKFGTSVSVVIGRVHLPSLENVDRAKALAVALNSAMQFMQAAVGQADRVSRIDEDQFGVVLTSISHSRALKISQRARMTIEKCRLTLPEGLGLTFAVSFGVTEATTDDTAESCLGRCRAELESAGEGRGTPTDEIASDPAGVEVATDSRKPHAVASSDLNAQGGVLV